MAATSTAARAIDSASTAYERFAGFCAWLAAASGLLYSISFVVLRNPALSALFLLLGGLFATPVLVALYQHLRGVDHGLALWTLLLSFAGALGSALHGGYDLSNALNRPVSLNAELPSAVDPRGLLTFGIMGVGTLANAWLVGRHSGFPAGLDTLGYVLGALLLVLYLARLPGLAPTNPLLLVPALLTGFVVNPAWYAWLGRTLLDRTVVPADGTTAPPA